MGWGKNLSLWYHVIAQAGSDVWTVLTWSFQIRATLPVPYSPAACHITQTIQTVLLLGALSCLLSEFKSPFTSNEAQGHRDEIIYPQAPRQERWTAHTQESRDALSHALCGHHRRQRKLSNHIPHTPNSILPGQGWHRPVIPAAQEAEAGELTAQGFPGLAEWVQGSPRQPNVNETLPRREKDKTRRGEKRMKVWWSSTHKVSIPIAQNKTKHTQNSFKQQQQQRTVITISKDSPQLYWGKAQQPWVLCF